MEKILTVMLCLASAGAILAAPDPGTRHDWPVWSGPQRNLTSLGNGVFERESFGLERVWSRPLGSAYSGIAIVGGHVVTGFSDGESDFLVSLDAESGKERWRYRIADTYKGHDGSDDGPISTPTIAGGRVYGLGPWGHLFALALDDGKELWAVHTVDELGARKPEYGFTTTPTLIGDVLVVETGGADGRSISAFDPATGELRWSAGDDAVGYQSPLALEIGGEVQVLAVTNQHMMGLDPATGEALWQHQHDEGEHDGFSQPVPVGEDGVLLTYWGDSALFKIAKNGGGYGVEEVWRTKALRGTYAIPIPYDGHLYGFAGSFLTCVDAATGETVWKSRPPGRGDLVLVDGHLVIQARSGDLVVAEATPEGYREKARVKALDRGYYTRPSFAAGRVYVRNLSDVAAVGVTDRAAPAPVRQAEAGPQLHGVMAGFVEKVQAAEDKRAVVDAFLAEHPEVPIVDGEWVHFVYRGEVEDLVVGGNLFQDGQEHPLHRIEGTDVYFLSVQLPAKSHFTYHFAQFDERMPDPKNPRKVGPEGREQSVLTTAGWEEPAHLAEPEGERGRLEKLTWKSEILGNEREVQVYLPAGYGEGEARYPLLVVNHGDQALELGRMANTLDNLIGRSVAPVVAAFVPRASWPEFAGSQTAEYAKALAEELVPKLEQTFRTRPERAARAVMGPGSAGFASIFAAFKRPGLFGHAAAHSFYKGDLHDDLLAMISDGEKRDLGLVFHTSSHDYRDPSNDFDARRDTEDVVARLEAKGYVPRVIRSDDGAGWGMWVTATDDVLEAFFPAQ